MPRCPDAPSFSGTTLLFQVPDMYPSSQTNSQTSSPLHDVSFKVPHPVCDQTTLKSSPLPHSSVTSIVTRPLTDIPHLHPTSSSLTFLCCFFSVHTALQRMQSHCKALLPCLLYTISTNYKLRPLLGHLSLALFIS